MCGRFTLHHTLDEIEERFAAEAAVAESAEAALQHRADPGHFGRDPERHARHLAGVSLGLDSVLGQRHRRSAIK